MSSKLIALVLLACSVPGAHEAGCRHRRTGAEDRQSERATAAAEEIAGEASVTSATLVVAERHDTSGDTGAAFRLEQSDYRARLERALDRLDRDIGQPAASPTRSKAKLDALRAQRELLKSDLQALSRSTVQDWAMLRAKLERDLGQQRPR